MASPQRLTPAEPPPSPEQAPEVAAHPAVHIIERAAGEALASVDGGAELADATGDPQVTFAQIRAYGNSLAARIALLAIALVLLAGVYAQSLSGALRAGSVVQRGFGAAVITLGCALPSVLMYCMKVLVVGSLNARVRFRLPLPAERPAGADAEDARRLWHHELGQFDQRSSRLSQHVHFYGFFCTVALSVAALLIMGHAARGADPARGGVAVAAAAAAVVAFVADVSRMIVRAANRDASARMFAWASKRFLLIVLSAVLLGTLVLLGKAEVPLSGGNASWLLLGAGLAFLGDRASQLVGERVAGALGAPPARRGEPGDLARIDGLSEEDVARLAEEGIASVHALALHATPKLFLATPFTLQQLCDWQDQALLIVRLGASRAALCRDQLALRGATDAQRLARDYLADRLTAEEKGDLAKVLGLSSTVQASALMRRLAEDPVAARLEIFRRAVPELDPAPPS